MRIDARRSLVALAFAILLLAALPAAAQVDVTASAGTPAASYTTLKGAFDAINAGTHQGVIGIGISGNTTETATAALNGSGTGAALYTSISIQPTGGAARTITGAIVAGSPLIDFNGADNVTVDGLNTGGNTLTISNTTVSATSGTSTIRFQADATSNLLTRLSVLGSATMAPGTNGGNIFFGSAAVATGNDNNTVSNCIIGPAGANLPTKGIYFSGSSNTDPGTANSGITIDNNQIFDYFSPTVSSAGIDLNSGTVGTVISNNRFFQTASRTMTSTGLTHSGIRISNSSGNAFQITGNTIGFANAGGTGTYTLVFPATTTAAFIPINVAVNTVTVTNITGNTIAGIALSGAASGTSTGAPFRGIYVSQGLATANNNVFGSQSATGSITYTSTATGASDVIGIFNFGTSNWTTNGNTIGGISVANSSTGAANFYGLRTNTASGVTWTCQNNTIGGTVANSIQSTTTATGTLVQGILNSNPIGNFTGNTIRNMTVAGGTGTTTTASMVGMVLNATAANQTLSQNTIFNLSNTNTTAATVVTGIQFNGSTANLVERNFIHSLTSATNSATAEVNGIRVSGGTTVYRNNMIALGAGISNALGGAATNSSVNGVNGFNEFLGTNTIFHNSIYIGGSPTAGTGSSFAFNGSQTTNTRSFRGNIFYNARNNSGATGKNYAVKINGTVPNPTGLTINNNVYLANGTGGIFGFFNSADVANLAAWRIAVGQDLGSFGGFDPQFLAPTAATPDLHIHPTNVTVIEGNGVDVGVVDDFDGQTRAGLTPVDIGADAGNFVGADLTPPAISYTLLGNTSLTTNRTLVATLTDVTGVATGGVSPRVYYRKNAGAYFSQGCSLSSGTVNSGNWDCVINNTDLGGVAPTDVIGYFVIAQDTLGNLGSSPGGVVATDVNTVTTPPTPNTYTIVPGLSGPISVGTGETITSLTNAGGLFEAINNGALTADVVVNITTDLLAELGTHALNQWAEDGVGGYSVLIKPSGAPRTISGTNAGALIRLNGADRVRFDGSTAAALVAPEAAVGGTPALRELTITNINTGTSAVVISVQTGTNGAQNVTLENLIVRGQDPTTTLAAIAVGGNTPGTVGADNDNLRIENCAIRRAIYGIYVAGFSAANPNLGNVITRNDVAATAAERIRRVGIVVFNASGITITENAVGGIDTNESADGLGIGVGTQGVDNTLTTAGGVTGALVSRNQIQGVNSQSATGFSAVGIAVAGSPGAANVIVNNMISGVISPATSPDLVAGIFVAGVTGTSTRVLFNSVSMTGDRGVVATQTPSFALAISGADPVVELKNNAFSNTQISGGGANADSYAIGTASTTFANLDSNFNDFFASGANASFFRSGSLGGGAGTEYATVAAWGAAVSDDANSLQVDPLFVSASDLHLQTTSTLVGTGTPIAGVSVDFDNETRSGTVPTIGADEIFVANLGITKTDGITNATPGGSTTYTIIASNAGPSDTTGTVADTFPASLTCTWTCAGAGGGTCTAAGAGNINDAVSLPSGGSVTYTASCAISASATGSLANTATVTGAATDPVPGNNSATDTDTLVGVADVAIGKTVNNASPTVGNNVIFTITASNNGPSDASGLSVNDLLPAGLTFVSAVASTGSYNNVSGVWTIGNLANGASATLTLTATVTRAETQVNVASKGAHDQVDPVGSNNTASVQLNGAALIDIQVGQTVDNATPGIGQNVTFLVTARNAGPATATLVSLTDNVPAGLTFVSSVPSQGTYTSGTGVWDVGTLASGASATLQVVLTNTLASPIPRTVTKTSATEADLVTGNDASSVVLNPAAPFADLAISKLTMQEPVSNGLTFNYTLAVTNLGAGDATGVTVTDNLPAGVTLVTATPSQGSCSGTTTVTCSLGSMLVGGTATVDLVVTKIVGGPVTNTASVAANENDPNLNNNSNVSTTTPVELMSFEVE